MSRRGAACVLTFAALMSAGRGATAQAPSGSGPATGPTATAPVAGSNEGESSKQAAALYKEGGRMYSAKRWSEAEALFQKAWALNPTFDVAYNLGSTEYQLGKYREAATHLSFALRVWPLLESTSKLKPIAEQRLRESRAAVGTLHVKVNVAQAAITIDGELVGTSPLPGDVFVAPDVTHTVDVKLEGFESAQKTVTVPKGMDSAVDVVLAVVPTKGSGAENAAGDGEGKPPGGTKGDEKATTGGARKPLIIAGAATSGALLGAGVVFAIVSSVKGSSADAQQTALTLDGGGTACEKPMALAARCAELKTTLGARDTLRDVAIWSFVAGGVFGVATSVYGVITAKPKAKQPGSLHVLPAIFAGGGAVLVAGEW